MVSDVVKLFPGSLMGPGFIKDVKGPIPHVEINAIWWSKYR